MADEVELSRLNARIEELSAQGAETSRLRTRCAAIERERAALETSLQADVSEQEIERTLAGLRALELEYRAAHEAIAARASVEADLAATLVQKAQVLSELARPVAAVLVELAGQVAGMRERLRAIEHNLERAQDAHAALNALIEPLTDAVAGAVLDIADVDVIGVPMKHLGLVAASAQAEVAAIAVADLRKHLAGTSATLAAELDAGSSKSLQSLREHLPLLALEDLFVDFPLNDLELWIASHRWRDRASASLQQTAAVISALQRLAARYSADLDEAEDAWRELVTRA